ITYWSRVSLISCGVGTWVIASATSRSSSSARISLQRAMHSLQMYTLGPEMNFRTESLDFPQNEQRRCLSCDMTDHSTGGAETQRADIQQIRLRGAGNRVGDKKELRARPRPSKRRPKLVKVFTSSGPSLYYLVTACRAV